MTALNFHDGHFDGIKLESEQTLSIFLRAFDKTSYTLVLRGVRAMTVSDVKSGNIILDLVFRSSREGTSADVIELYDIDANSSQLSRLLHSMREMSLQLLELNPSYGAKGLFLFESYEMIPNDRT